MRTIIVIFIILQSSIIMKAQYLGGSGRGDAVFILNNSPLPVELNSFTARVTGSTVILNWSTETETNNYGFDVERSETQDARGETWKKIGFINGYGNSNLPKAYLYKDENPLGGSQFQYRLKQIDNDGRYEYSDAIEVIVVPKEFIISQNYPNPFNPKTKITYSVPFDSRVTISVYSITGELVVELLNDFIQAGSYFIDFDGSNLASGMYIYKMTAGNFSKTNKFMLLK